ncbi:MAG: S-methyl-5'-thioadenosine phosphorylase [Lentisphaerae bacterium]|nr:S-methyl-5'-thioadenosine phosphorylase [Lentisphaerota bacterium]MCP4101953.1 S-methyl-5'-thioadenosine phosphorylase [Lentisphaerota bacterium]
MKLGVIGGSGLYQIEGTTDIRKEKVTTPFGDPSDEFIIGKLDGKEVVFLPRHGQGHPIAPGELNHQANIYAMKKLDVTHILSVSAVGSLKQEMKPRDVVIVDQYFDRTKRGPAQTFFGNGIVAHVAMAHPVCPEMAAIAAKTAHEAIAVSEDTSRDVHEGGTYVNMEGPAFSTQAESNFYRAMGMSVIGMTNMAEAKLAREAEICYCTVAMVTDYDCWHPEHDHVTVDLVISHLVANTALAKDIIHRVSASVTRLEQECPCPTALASSVITAPDAMPSQTKQDLELIIGKYVK